MTSQDLQGFSSWTPFSNAGIAGAPNKAGLYVIRAASGTLFGRLRGESDMVYVGSGSRIRQRLEQHLQPRDDERDVGYRLKRVQSEVGLLEVCWRECGSRTNAEFEEGKILRQYTQQHIELPPLNRQEAAKKSHYVLRLIAGLPPEQQAKLFEEALRRKANLSESRIQPTGGHRNDNGPRTTKGYQGET